MGMLCEICQPIDWQILIVRQKVWESVMFCQDWGLNFTIVIVEGEMTPPSLCQATVGPRMEEGRNQRR